MHLEKIKTVDIIEAKDFKESYVKPLIPLVIKELSKDWPAREKWSLDYFAQEVGEVEVPLYNSEPAKGKELSRKPAARMLMKNYVELLKNGPTDLRIFFFNMLQKAPQLMGDFKYPNLGIKFFKKLPVLFFGGAGSRVLLHYDMDFANNLHFNFVGEKEVILFPHDQKTFLYHVPHSIVAMESIEFDDPDYDKFPALKYAKGFKVLLQPGDMLYIPSGYWHYIRYKTPSVSLTLRSFPSSFPKKAKFLRSILFTMHFDNIMRKLKGQKWVDYKNQKAIKIAHKATEDNKLL
ncbi:cupin-like domain-containing protein [Mesonia ostreae]|uniref:Cupin-like domain-containing protein n=1 Tax=Mesonia ostreae TaxID=861110 RepID=A0ABU2KKR9_9FLAO|nr:cupin-like domain-containing protein [Mesonia ostreae]MDT0295274.1 cupin-like domain-containing protein [Mesonia ostreae]